MADAADAHHGDAATALTRLVRDEGRAVLASLAGRLGDLGLAEDAVQEAALQALDRWGRDGIPPNPRAWLLTTARHRALDRLRREARRTDKETEAVAMLEHDPAPPSDSAVHDDLLRLVFTCCHPSLAPETQVALSLRTLCGLTTAEVARALVVSEATMTKRLTRARRKIAVAAIPYRVPADHELPYRVAQVATTVYLVFNEGFAATGGDAHQRADLAEEAIRLGRLLVDLLPGDPALEGLLALMLLQDARREARTDAEGAIVLLPDQDRARWDRAAIEEAVVLIGDALRRTPDRPDPYVVQAAIAAVHALSPSWEATDQAAIVSWYDVLLTVADTPIARLNRAVALAERDGAAAGLAVVEQLHGLDAHAPWHAVRADLLARTGRTAEAVAALDAALELVVPAPVRAHLLGRRAALTARPRPVPEPTAPA